MFLLMTTTGAFSVFAISCYCLLRPESHVFLAFVERLNLKGKSFQQVELFGVWKLISLGAVIPSGLGNFMTTTFLFRGLCGSTGFTLLTAFPIA